MSTTSVFFRILTTTVLLWLCCVVSFNPLLAFHSGNSQEIANEWRKSSECATASTGFVRTKFENIAGDSIRTVVIDAGHGGRDQGCSGRHSHEKHITLSIARELAQQIRERYPELRVVMTRETDVFVPLNERAATANRNEADLFISIHCNAVGGLATVRGSETYVLGNTENLENEQVARRENAVIKLESNYEQKYGFDPDSPEAHIITSLWKNFHLEQSIQFANLVESHAQAGGRRSRGVKQGAFVVLRQTRMPAVLIETGFLSNSNDEDFLRTLSGQRTTAAAIFQAFRDYKRQVEYAARHSAPTAETTPSEHPDPKAETKTPPIIVVQEPVRNPTQTTPPARAEGTPVFVSESTTKTTQTEFRVQLAASRVVLDKDWSDSGYRVHSVLEDRYHKYQTAGFGNFDDALRAQRAVRKRGYPGAFVVAYVNGVKVPVAEARGLVRP